MASEELSLSDGQKDSPGIPDWRQVREMGSEGTRTCRFGHHWYTGATCPLCDYLGREILEEAYSGGPLDG